MDLRRAGTAARGIASGSEGWTGWVDRILPAADDKQSNGFDRGASNDASIFSPPFRRSLSSRCLHPRLGDNQRRSPRRMLRTA